MDKIEYEKKLENLKDMFNGGIITKSEYNEQKRRYKDMYSKGKSYSTVNKNNYSKPNIIESNTRTAVYKENNSTIKQNTEKNSDENDDKKDYSIWGIIVFIPVLIKILSKLLD